MDHNSAGPVPSARSALFVPGDRPERFAKAAASGADVVILDLEDAVASDHKQAGRHHIRAWLDSGGRAAVRVNGPASAELEADYQALEGATGLLAVMVPKAEEPTTLTDLGRQLGRPVLALVETARGIMAAPRIAGAGGVVRLGLGHLDLATDLGSSTGREAMVVARSALVLASRAAGLPGPFDGVTTALDDPAVCEDDARYAASLGYTGKFAIHPRQVPVINSAFAPSREELAWAREILAASSGGGAVRARGQMVDAPVVARAQQLLARAGREDS